MDYPSSVRTTSGVAVVAIFTALVVGSDFALAPLVNFKLLDTIVFAVSFVFGFRKGAAVAVLSETIWSFVSPWGPAGVLTPFLVGGELLFVVAGWAASRVWRVEGKAAPTASLFIGATMAICAFLWDFETNAASALIWNWPGLNLANLVAVEVAGFLFPVPLAHELTDLFLGAFLVPTVILLVPRVMRGA
jgi:uncharacterized membrane protein